jgi:hypothetical protein
MLADGERLAERLMKAPTEDHVAGLDRVEWIVLPDQLLPPRRCKTAK